MANDEHSPQRPPQRPPVWVGHVAMGSHRFAESKAWMESIGMRPIESSDEVAVFELRGGTHLVLIAADRPADGAAPFDLMVDDLEATHRDFQARGLDPSPITERPFHRAFTVREPSGHAITFQSSHVSGQPV